MASTASSSISEDPAAPPPRSSWVILGSIARVVDHGQSVALTSPPCVSRLTVSSHVFPDRPTPKNFPFVLAADSSGLLLLSSILATPLTRVDIDRPDLQSLTWRDTDDRFFVLDATTGSEYRLPDPKPQERINYQDLLGLLVRSGVYMVAELMPVFGSDEATIRCYSSDVGEWVDKSVRYPLPPRPLSPICTLAHHGRLWWVDYSWGIVTADPFADDPTLGFIPLPRPLEYREAPGVLDMFRYVGVSAGKLRFVDTYRRGGAPNKVTVWTLPDPDARKWTVEHEATLADIWADESYKATGLPNKTPVVALIHPTTPPSSTSS
ncbi:hypothetical protein HU200_010740 [Digitaria exilis]|uniref:DUF1618 domain-containing protein n=1 Tax=Digitaria exilis TaxID=1010633 RepID=A0A835FIM3_9POAL|nr:hypothetical protein HU200_010740 [Digitaria exilis]